VSEPSIPLACVLFSSQTGERPPLLSVHLIFLGRAYKLDVTAELDIEETINQIVREFNGRLDVFVANSGVPWLQGDAVDGDTSHYRKVMATNLDGVFFCARAAGKHWRRQAAEGTTTDGNNLAGFKQGSFIATASMCGHVVNIPLKQAPYNASKAAVIHLCESRSCPRG
jgi:sorbose reductase